MEEHREAQRLADMGMDPAEEIRFQLESDWLVYTHEASPLPDVAREAGKDLTASQRSEVSEVLEGNGLVLESGEIFTL